MQLCILLDSSHKSFKLKGVNVFLTWERKALNVLENWGTATPQGEQRGAQFNG